MTVLFLPLVVFAQSSVTIENPLGNQTITDVLNRIIDYIFYIAVIAIAPIIYIFAGYKFLTAMGDPEKINLAKRMLIWTTIGLIVIILAKGLVVLLKEILSI